MAAETASCASCHDVTDEERYAQLDDVLTQYPGRAGALIPVLQIAQAIFGYLPDAALRRISVALGKSYSEVAGVVGFYSFFTTVPRGRHLIRVCLGTACYVRGGKNVLAALRMRCVWRWGRRRRTRCSRWTSVVALVPAVWRRSSWWMTTCMSGSVRGS